FALAKELGMPAVGLTDHGNLFGAVEFYEAAHKHGLKPILGCEVYLAAGSRFDRELRERDEAGFDAINHLLLLAMDETGYRNLMMLVSRAYLEGFYYKPRIDQDLLRQHHEGLIATSGCLSSLTSRAISAGQLDQAWRIAEDFAALFGDRFYLELQRHGIGDQDRVNSELVKMAADLRLPLLATNDAHYLAAEDHRHHDALLCIGTGKNLDDPNRFRFDGHGFYLKSGDEMAELFHDPPSALASTLEIAERCRVDLGLDSGRYHLPEFQLPAGATSEAVLAEQAWAGLRRRLRLDPGEPIPPRFAEDQKRMGDELGGVGSVGVGGHFPVLRGLLGHAAGPPSPGGS